ncbi:MAG: hypothetical protein RIR18_847 [Pseudomonadota bacterium]
MKLKVLLCWLATVLLPVAAFSVEPTAPASSEEKIAKGLLLQHEGRKIFSPCRHRSYYQLEDVSPNAEVSAQLAQLGLADGKNIYVEFLSVIVQDQLQVKHINLARTEARCHEAGGPDEVWRAAGSQTGQETAWQLVVAADELLLTRPGKPELKLAYKVKNGEGGAVVLSTPEKPETGWRILRQYCQDKTSGTLYGWRAELTVDGEVLKGCAWQR